MVIIVTVIEFLKEHVEVNLILTVLVQSVKDYKVPKPFKKSNEICIFIVVEGYGIEAN